MGGKVNFFGKIALLFSCAAALTSLCGADGVPDDAASALRKVVIALPWQPQAQFAGFYVAREAGYFAAHGLDVQFRHVDVERDTFDELEFRRSDVACGWLSSALLHVMHGDDIVNIAQYTSSTGLLLVARKSSGIRTLDDLSGRRLGLWINKALRRPLSAVLAKHKITPEVLPVLQNIDIFLYGGVDAVNATSYNEYFQIWSSGVNPDELLVLPVSELSNLPGDGLYVRRSFRLERPDDCRNLRAALLSGWRRAFRNKSRTLEIIKEYCREHKQPFNVAAQMWMLDNMEKIVFPADRVNDGKLREEAFSACFRLLSEADCATPARSLRFRTFCPDDAEKGNKP